MNRPFKEINMARKLAAVITATGRGWSFNDTVTGESRMIVELPTSGETVTQLALYGLKQAVADGGAKAKGTSLQSRLDGMAKRYEQIMTGDWSFRDGTGTASLPDGDVYRAIVALGVADDTAERREKWKGLKPAQRRAIAGRDDVKAWIAANVTTDDDTADAALESFLD
jgi:hypothetical protein